MEHLTILNDLRSQGFRITNIRKALVSVLSKSPQPLSVSQILSKFHKNDLTANKTTVYREIDFLKKLNIVREVEFGDGKKRYELLGADHHHHIVCVKCANISDFDFDIDLKKHERSIEKQTGYMIMEHSIEFFGVCQNCQRNKKIA
jgi:Fe2+ or Zn2+ uptake regulation protein